MARTYRNSNVEGNEKSNKGFKRNTNKKLRKQTKNLLKNGNFDVLNDSLNSVSEIWTSNKEFKRYEV